MRRSWPHPRSPMQFRSLHEQLKPRSVYLPGQALGPVEHRRKTPLLEISHHRQYLTITSRSYDVLLTALAVQKRALPVRVERPFSFQSPGTVRRAGRACPRLSRPFNTEEEKREGRRRNWSPIGPPADAYAQPPPARSRLLVLRRAVSPACPSLQGCSAAVAPVRPLGGPGGVFERNEDRKGRQGAVPQTSRKDRFHAYHQGRSARA